MFTGARAVVADPTIPITNDVAVATVYVIVHRYHLSRQGIIVDVTPADRLPIVPVRRFKFENLMASPKK